MKAGTKETSPIGSSYQKLLYGTEPLELELDELELELELDELELDELELDELELEVL